MSIENRYKEVKAKHKKNQVFSALQRAVLTHGRQATKDEKSRFGIGLYDTAIKREGVHTVRNLEIIKAIRDINPDASLAMWNFQRLSNQGHEVTAFFPNGDVDERATDYLNNDLAPRVGKLYRGGMDMLVNVLNLSSYTYGANALEVELNEGLNEVVDFHAVLPTILEFRQNKETLEYELGITKAGEFVVLNPNQVFYSPIDPDIDEPLGRSPLMPTLNSIFFQVAVLNDLKAVMHHQGHARFDIKVLAESIYDNIPPEIEVEGEEAIQSFVSTFIENVKSSFKDLGPDDNFVHDDTVEIDMVGGMSGSMDATAIVAIIDKQVTASLKHLPILLGRSESTSETHATIQWQIFKAGIRSMQKATERTIENAYNVALRVKGFQSKANVEFNELNVADRAKEATAEKTEIENMILKVQQGWIDNDEAANEMVGHDAVAEPQQVQTSNFPQRLTAKTRQTRRLTAKKTRVDEYIREMGTDYAQELAEYAPDAIDDTTARLSDEVEAIIKRMELAGQPPASVLVEAKHLRDIRMSGPLAAAIPPPPNLFQFWIESKILTPELKSAQANIWKGLISNIGTQAANIAGVANLFTLGLDINFDKTDKQLQDWIQDRAARNSNLIRGVNDKQVLNTLWEEVYSGKYSVPSAAERLRNEYDFSEKRAKVIARTEIIGAGHAGQYNSDKQSGIVIAKVWQQTLDSRTRDAHNEAAGQTVAFDDPFIVGGEKMLHPSDDSLGATARNIIQCRCFYLRILEGEEWQPLP